MHVIQVWDVNYALFRGYQHLYRYGIQMESRAGSVLVAPTPVTTVYSHPWNRVLLEPARKANPYFHLMESLWMLAGRNDVAFVEKFNQRMSQFSDDGTRLQGAYGYRWRVQWDDQLKYIITLLKKDPLTRRAVLAMWGADDLYDQNSKDLPCNTTIYFSTVHGVLDMTICCRSNDIIWGAYGANAVHFSMLMEYVAAGVGMRMGTMYQISNNYHMYQKREDVVRLAPVLMSPHYLPRPYPEGRMPLVETGLETIENFDDDLEAFFVRYDQNKMLGAHWNTKWFANVAFPMYLAHYFYRQGAEFEAKKFVNIIQDGPWKTACSEWMSTASFLKGNHE